MTISSNELYGELWSRDQSPLETELAQSLHPRATTDLYDVFTKLGVGAEHIFLDAGARDAVHAAELIKRIGCRAVAVDPVPLHVERAKELVSAAGLADRIDVVEAGLESLPFEDGAFDFVWCRDVLNHVDLAPALAECARVLRPGGSMLVYQTFATASCEPEEAQRLFDAIACRAENMSPSTFERRAEDAGLTIVKRDEVRGEWRERMLEEGTWDVAADLLALSRLERREAELVERYGRAAVEAERGGLIWGIYQFLGKTCPTIYVLERRA